MDEVAAVTALKRLGELMETLDVICRMSVILQGTSGHGSSHMRK
jgi:hypothetical protein